MKKVFIVFLMLFMLPIAQAMNIDEVNDKIDFYSNRKNAAHNMAESARILGNVEVINIAKQEWEEANNEYIKYKNIYDSYWFKREEEYPVATKIWKYLRSVGYSEEVCAGILGNIMVECGGNTLNIIFNASNSTYYGICQWKAKEIRNSSLDEQLKYLIGNIESELDTFGYAYQKNFNFSKFLQLNNVEEISLAFAKCYERCGSGSYSKRKKCAIKAFEYYRDV